jgi:hypothetical protein
MHIPGPNILEEKDAHTFIKAMEEETNTVKDCLLAAKLQQAHFANKDCLLEPSYKVGDKVMLTTTHRRRDYIQAKDRCVAKFMPQFDDPYDILEAFPLTLLYKIKLPPTSTVHPTFHISHLHPYIPNDDDLFPNHAHHGPKPLLAKDGTPKYFIDKIVDCQPRGWGHQFLVCWSGYRHEHDL